MKSNQTNPPTRFIRFNEFHIAPLRDVTVRAIKEAAHLARSAHRDREPMGLTTARNHVAKALGFKGGFAGFQQECIDRLQGFMKEHGLEKRYDLITPRFDLPLFSLKPKQIADRLFRLGQPLPTRIFTGYDVDWYAINNRHFNHNPWKSELRQEMDYLAYAEVEKEYSQAKTQSAELGIKCLEAAIEYCRWRVATSVGNLLGDQLLEFGDSAVSRLFVPRIYKPGDLSPENFHAEEQKCREVARLFRFWIEQLKEGWVEVIPYSGSLVFLKGEYGEYDFVFPGFRDEPFDHQVFGRYLHTSDTPKSNDAYHFKRWLYFEYNGWLEEDEHNAEINYYAGGGKPKDWPSEDDLLRAFLVRCGKYVPPKKSAEAAAGFYPVTIEGNVIYVSNLVSIRDFKEFMGQNPEYAAYSRKPEGVDRWETVNCEENESLPAAVTWYDANAYAAWISKTRKLPVRLLSEEEFNRVVRPVLNPLPGISDQEFLSFEHKRLCRFYLPDGTPLDCHAPYMMEKDFQNLNFRFIPEAMVWKNAPNGLAFLVSHHFAEWLNEESAAVNTLTMSCPCYLGYPPSKGRFSPTSTGKYKSKKIGFRLCYHGDVANLQSTNP